MKKRFLLLFLSVFLIIPLAMAYSHFCVLNDAPQSSKLNDDVDSELWLDDFTSYNARWNWAYNAGTGYKTLGTIDSYSVCEGGVTDASTSDEYSDCSLHHFLTVDNDEPVSAEMRMRYTDSNGLAVGDHGKGTRGCGWWDGSAWGDNVAWFVAFSPGNDESLVGYKCQVRVGGTWVLNEDISDVVDMTEWHIYRVDMTSDGTFFYVDDELVASTPYRPQAIVKLEAWVDNAYFYYDNDNFVRGCFDLSIDQKMYIDWVKLSKSFALISPEASFSYSPLNPEISEVVTFDASSSSDPDGTVVSYFWDFGDGNTENSLSATVIHSYTVKGTYTVTLTVTDNDGLTDTTSHTIIEVIPEFSASTFLILFVLFTMAVVLYRKRK
jgi:hypothetical protein